MSEKRSACFLCLCSPLVSLLRNIGIQPAPNHQVFPLENVPGGRDGDRGGNEHSLAFIFSQKNARQMVAQRFLPFSLIAPHPGCLGKQCSSTHICNEISKAAVLQLPPIYCGCPCLCFMVGFHPGSSCASSRFPVSLWTGDTGLLPVSVILSRFPLQEPRVRKFLPSP